VYTILAARDHRPESGTFKDMDLNDKVYLPIAFLGKLRRVLERDTLCIHPTPSQ
jgi:hypothetical protein